VFNFIPFFAMKPQCHYLILFFLVFLISCSEKELTPTKSNSKKITSFTITNISPNIVAVVDTVAHTVQLTFPIGTDVTNLTPTIITSPKSSITPGTNVPQDFSKSLNYVVTAEDGTTQSYTVKTTVLKSAAKRIVSFSFAGLSPVVNAVIDSVKHTISATVPINTEITQLVPTISISEKATITPNSLIKQDFSKPVNYIITAEDGTSETYVATVSIPKSNERKITSFQFDQPIRTLYSRISEDFDHIDIILMEGTDLTKLTPSIVISKNATISPAMGMVQDFSNPVVYTVTAENGVSRTYKVTVTAQKSISNEPAKGMIAGSNFTVKTALMKETSSTGAWRYRLDFFSQDASCGNSNYQIEFTLKAPEVGIYVMEQANFQTGGSNPTYFEAEVTITKVTATTIEGKLRGGSTTEKNYLEGSFSATICK
jgi:hypothetical protein